MRVDATEKAQLEARLQGLCDLLGSDGNRVSAASALLGRVALEVLPAPLRRKPARALRQVQCAYETPAGSLLFQAFVECVVAGGSERRILLAVAAAATAPALNADDRCGVVSRFDEIGTLSVESVLVLRAIAAAPADQPWRMEPSAGLPAADVERILEDLRKLDLVEGDRPTAVGAAFARAVDVALADGGRR
jgi:hypothetical protein